MIKPDPKPIHWIGDSRDALREFPDSARREVGRALYLAQLGDKHPTAKPLKGFGGAGVLEVVESYEGDAYRAVYTVKFAGIVYVLHCFQKKSKQGKATPKAEIDLIKNRLFRAQIHYGDEVRS
jgi:phage-related protein